MTATSTLTQPADRAPTGAEISFVRIRIEALEPFTIANPEGSLRVDRPVVCDITGRPIVPASGLIGSLRSHLGAKAATYLGGSSSGQNTAGPELIPSPLRALGTKLSFAEDMHVPVTSRQQTSIDRCRGAAMSKTLHTTERVGAGATVTLWCEYDGALPAELVKALGSWHPILGGSSGTGNGRAKVTAIETAGLDLADPKDLARLVGGITPLLRSDDSEFWSAKAVDSTQTNGAIIDCEATIVDGLFIGGMTPDTTTDGERNVAASYRYREQHTIEGSSIRGVLRSTVAFIASSVLRAHDDGVTVDEAIARGNRIGDELFGSPHLRGNLVVASSPIVGAGDTSVPSIETRMHVGIDRFTGSARDRLLFGEKVLTAGRFKIHVDSRGDLPGWAEPLLMLALRDIHDGLVGFGGRTARGLGTVKLDVDFSQVAGLTTDQVQEMNELSQTKIEPGRRSSERARQSRPSKRDKNEERQDSHQDAAHANRVARNSGPAASYSMDACLKRVGRLQWSELVDICDDLTCMWSDLDGLHVGALPESVDAIGSHVWAWGKGRWVRARIDGDRCFAAELHSPSDDGPDELDRTQVVVSSGIPWLGDSEQLPRAATANPDGSLHVTGAATSGHWLFTTRTAQPITFLQMGGENPTEGLPKDSVTS